MNKFIIICCGFLMTCSLFAAENKRPSWSQGLPERKDQTNPQLKINKPTINVTIEHDLQRKPIKIQSEQRQPFNNPTENPEIITELPQPPLPPKEPPADYQHQLTSSPITIIQSKTQNQQDSVQYPWEITRMTAVSVPRHWLLKYPSALLNISIDPSGQVNNISVNNTNPIPEALKIRIERSVKQWRFSAPEDYGITQNISRPFKIQLQAD